MIIPNNKKILLNENQFKYIAIKYLTVLNILISVLGLKSNFKENLLT